MVIEPIKSLPKYLTVGFIYGSVFKILINLFNL